MRPMDDASLRIADELALEGDDIANGKIGDALALIDIVGNQDGVPALVGQDEPLMARRLEVVIQYPRDLPCTRHP